MPSWSVQIAEECDHLRPSESFQREIFTRVSRTSGKGSMGYSVPVEYGQLDASLPSPISTQSNTCSSIPCHFASALLGWASAKPMADYHTVS